MKDSGLTRYCVWYGYDPRERPVDPPVTLTDEDLEAKLHFSIFLHVIFMHGLVSSYFCGRMMTLFSLFSL